MWCKFKSIIEKLSDQLLNNEEKIFGLIDAPKKSKPYPQRRHDFTIRHILINNRLNSLDEDSITSLSQKMMREEINYNHHHHHAKCHGDHDNFKINFVCADILGKIEDNKLLLQFYTDFYLHDLLLNRQSKTIKIIFYRRKNLLSFLIAWSIS